MKHLVTTSELPDVDGAQLSIWQTARADLRAASGLGILAVALLLVWMAFQWGFGNDALLPWFAALAFDAVDDRETWSQGIAAIGATALAGFTFWAVTQAFDAIVVLAGLKLIPGLIERISTSLRAKGWVAPYAEMKWSTRWIIAYATGASAICLVDLFATGEHGVANRKKMIFQSVLLSAGSVGVVTGAVAFAAVLGVRIPATADGAEVFIRYARNPLTWIAIFGVVFLAGYLFGNNDEADTPASPSAANPSYQPQPDSSTGVSNPTTGSKTE